MLNTCRDVNIKRSLDGELQISMMVSCLNRSYTVAVTQKHRPGLTVELSRFLLLPYIPLLLPHHKNPGA